MKKESIRRPEIDLALSRSGAALAYASGPLVGASSFYIDPVNGSDVGTGSVSEPFRTWRRFVAQVGLLAQFNGLVTVFLLADLPPDDPMYAPSSWVFFASGQLVVFDGAPVLLASGGVTGYTPPVPGTTLVPVNQREKLVDTSAPGPLPIGECFIITQGPSTGAQFWSLKADPGDPSGKSVFITRPILRDPIAGGFSQFNLVPGQDKYKVVQQRKVGNLFVGHYASEGRALLNPGRNQFVLVNCEPDGFIFIQEIVEFNGCRVQEGAINHAVAFINVLFDGRVTGGDINIVTGEDPEGAQMLAGGWLDFGAFSLSGTFKVVVNPQVESCQTLFDFTTTPHLVATDFIGIWNSHEFLTISDGCYFQLTGELGLGAGLWGTGNTGSANLIIAPDGKAGIVAGAVMTMQGPAADFSVGGATSLPPVQTVFPWAYLADQTTTWAHLMDNAVFGRNVVHPPTGARIVAI